MAAMPDTNLPDPPKVFPDLATCRVKLVRFANCITCLSVWAKSCPHSSHSFGGSFSCQHPSALEILARSEVKMENVKPSKDKLIVLGWGLVFVLMVVLTAVLLRQLRWR